jgi:hypothetical protein
MCPTNGVVEGKPPIHSCASVRHEEIIDALRLIQVGQKDLESRLARVEHLLPEAKEGFKPTKALDKLGLFQNLRPGSSHTTNQDSRDAAALPPISLPIRRTRDIKDQMIEEAQERRERMHEVVDQIEVSSVHIAWSPKTSPLKQCRKLFLKSSNKVIVIHWLSSLPPLQLACPKMLRCYRKGRVGTISTCCRSSGLI